MLSLWRRCVLPLLLLTSGCETQSGDGHEDAACPPSESRLSCTSHIAKDGNSLTCELLGDEDDEDEDDDIERMTLCSVDWSEKPRKTKCLKNAGNTLNFLEKPVVDFNLSVHTSRGRTISTTVDLKKIVKPRRPQVWNVTFNQETNQLVVHIQSPYHHDYLRADNQLLQLHVWSSAHHMTQNVSSENMMKMDIRHLRGHALYQVTVRAIPMMPLQGSWSEWSDAFSFLTPAGAPMKPDPSWTLWLLPLIAAALAAVFCWKHKIVSYVWPSIPHPEDSLHISRSTGLLLNFQPEVFSDLSVSSGSTRSSHCSSEGAELPGRDLPQPAAEGPPKEAYVTMSSFYHIK